jgi:hypothetical protein
VVEPVRPCGYGIVRRQSRARLEHLTDKTPSVAVKNRVRVFGKVFANPALQNRQIGRPLQPGESRLDEPVEIAPDRDGCPTAFAGGCDRVDVLTQEFARLDRGARHPDLMLSHDHADKPTPHLHASRGGDVEVVGLRIAVRVTHAHVRGEHWVRSGIVSRLCVQLLDQRERFVDRLLIHVADVDQHLVLVHRARRRSAQTGESRGRLMEEVVVFRVGKGRNRRGVGRHTPEEQMCERDVQNALVSQPADVGVDRLLIGAEVKAALHAVDEHDAIVIVDVTRVLGDHVTGAGRVQLLQVGLDVSQLASEVVERAGPRGGIEGEFVRGPVQDRTHEPGAAAFQAIEVDAPPRSPARVVGQPPDNVLAGAVEGVPKLREEPLRELARLVFLR